MEAKAASVAASESFAVGVTLRFPRFRRLRLDKSWDQALNVQEFSDLRRRVEAEAKEKGMEAEDRKRYRAKRVKRDVVIAGEDAAPVQFQGAKTKVFEGLEFCVLSESLKPVKKTKTQLEILIKENGGRISQRAAPESNMILIGDKKVVKVASLIKDGDSNIIRPKWIFDCLAQGDETYLLPYEESHLFHADETMKRLAEGNTDKYGDSYARDIDVAELDNILRQMPKLEVADSSFDRMQFLTQLEDHGHSLGSLRGQIFRRCVVYLHAVEGGGALLLKMRNYLRFGDGLVVDDLSNDSLTHVVIVGSSETERAAVTASIQEEIRARRKIPRVVTSRWVEDCWKEKTLVDEERYGQI
jgi:DNA ligase 4